MNHSASIESIAAGERPFFNVVAAYENPGAGKRAMEVCHFLASKLGAEVELRSCHWQFDFFCNASFQRELVAEAVQADVIIVALQQGMGLAEGVKQWVEAWIPGKRGQTAALVALVRRKNGPAVQSTHLFNYLENAASRAGMDFFWAWMAGESGHDMLVASDAVLPTPEDWGLNE